LVGSCPSAAPEYEGRGADALNLELASIVERVLSRAIDRKTLCLVEGEQCWVLNIDALVCSGGGSGVVRVVVALVDTNPCIKTLCGRFWTRMETCLMPFR
jgi:exosome complex RNA-binding protein Rrp42 (RNase PH superfamily)